MKIIRVIVRYLLITIGVVFLALISLTAIYKERVAELFIAEINSRSEIKIQISDSRLSLLKRFPRGSFELRNVIVFSAPAFGGNDTLASVEAVSLEFSILDLLRKRYNVAGVTVTNGKVNILTDAKGVTSYPPVSGDTKKPASDINIDIKSIKLHEISLSIVNLLKESESNIFINSARVSGKIAGTNIGLSTDGEFEIRKMNMNGLAINNPINASLSLLMHKSDTSTFLEKGRLTLEEMTLSVEGGYIHSTRSTSLLLSADNVDIAKMAGFMPEKYRSFSLYRPSGRITAAARINGIITREAMLNIEVDFSLDEAKFEIPGTSIRLKESGITGSFTNGYLNNAHTSRLNLTRIDLRAGDSFIRGVASISNFAVPYLHADINSQLGLAEIASFINSERISKGEGVVRSSLIVSGEIPRKSDISFKALLALAPKGNIYFKDAGLVVSDYDFTDVEGNLMISENLWADSLSLTLNGQRIIGNGEITNFLSWAKGDAETVRIGGSISANLIDLSLFGKNGANEEKPIAPVIMPSGYEVSLEFSAGEFRHKTFSAVNITGILNYSAAVAKLDTFSMVSMGGIISGSATMVRRTNGSYSSNSSLSFNNIDITDAFTSFNNFRQSFILATNLRGSLSGRYTMRMDIDTMLNPVISSINSEGRFSIVNGELINFEPVKKMSKFIEISELENIKFSNLQNEFFISNETFSIPHMEIQSSAVDLGISGKHHFRGDYEYHARLQLSQILSGKAPRKTANNEFGIVEDDGLGRTSIFLKLVSLNGKESVSYDMAASRAEIRQDLNQEKQSLRAILKEEYGWYGKDSTVAPVKEQKPKFRIIWDEGATPPDTIRPDTVKVQKENPVRNLFKKIIKG
jgi:hypothetical protein